MDVWEIVQAALPSLLVSVAMGGVQPRPEEARRGHAGAGAAARLEAENVQVSLLVASAKLSYALAMAAKRGAPNGEVEDGVEQYREAMRGVQAPGAQARRPEQLRGGVTRRPGARGRALRHMMKVGGVCGAARNRPRNERREHDMKANFILWLKAAAVCAR